MVTRRLDEIVEESLQKRELTRRDFLRLLGFTALSVGVGFAGCSAPSGQRGFGLFPSQNTGYKLIYPDWTKPVPNDIISYLIEGGKICIFVWAPIQERKTNRYGLYNTGICSKLIRGNIFQKKLHQI